MQDDRTKGMTAEFGMRLTRSPGAMAALWGEMTEQGTDGTGMIEEHLR